MKYRKILFCLLILVISGQSIFAQCDFYDSSPITTTGLTVTHAYCPSGGSITIKPVSGGGGQYVYEIVDGPVIRIIQSQNTFNALPAGSYRIRITSCNGSMKDLFANINNFYTSMSSYYWQNALVKQSGFNCGVSNDGVYKLPKPSYTGGTGPFKIQISTNPSFTAVPFQPDNDSALFTGLLASTTYYVRITDACNNFVTFNFLTPAPTPVVPLSVPSLAFSRAYFYGDCTGTETVYMYFRDSATGGTYDYNNAYSNHVFWGNAPSPYLRIKVEDASNGALYADRNVTLSQSGNYYSMNTYTAVNGETGITGTGTGKNFYSPSTPAYTMPYIYASSTFPANAPLKVTIYFPGGNHCGIATPIPAYSSVFYYNLGTHGMPQPIITGVSPNCNTGGTYLKVDFNINYAGDTISLVKPGPTYTVLTKNSFNSYSSSYTTIFYNGFVVGDTYRVIVKDSCGRMDSMNVVYTPSSSLISNPVITDTVKAFFKCPANPNDTVYMIYLKPLPAGYSILNVTISGFGSVAYYADANWNNTGQTAYKLNRLLPPGTYTYSVMWLNNCQTGTVTQSVTILPIGSPPTYTRALNLSVVTSVGACYTDGYKAIMINGWVRNGNTNYTLNNLRITSAPNSYVYPLDDMVGFKINFTGSTIYMSKQNVGDTVKIYPGYSGIKITSGKEGTYTIAVDVICPDGTVLETLTKTIVVTAPATSAPAYPDLKYTNALICDGGLDLKMNLLPIGGTRPYTYQYKLATDAAYISSGGGGTDSIIIVDPAPPAGTVFDIRVTDACGNSASNRVTVANFTGRFFIYQYPVDCINNPFDVRVGTSYINGAYYTWKRNGVVIAQDYNLSFLTISGVSVDSITVDINMFDCYFSSVSRTIVSSNPCGYTVLPVNNLKFTGNRISETNVQLSWKTQNEQYIKYFEVEKSSDGTQFKYVGRVNGDNYNWEHSYVYTDLEASPVVFYRLKVVDQMDKTTYSNVVRVENKKVNKPVLQVSPNPAHDNISIQVVTPKVTSYKAKIYNDQGQLTKEVVIAPEEIAGGKKVDITSFAAGTYFISLIDNWEIVASTKFIKQ